MNIVLRPDKRLTTATKLVIDPPTDESIVRLFELMREKRGIGLAANQVGIDQSFFIADFSVGPVVCINPKITRHGSQALERPEGCLSILDDEGQFLYEPKKRWVVIDVEYTSPDWTQVKTTLKRNDARIFQHEMDHLEGKLCNDK